MILSVCLRCSTFFSVFSVRILLVLFVSQWVLECCGRRRKGISVILIFFDIVERIFDRRENENYNESQFETSLKILDEIPFEQSGLCFYCMLFMKLLY